MNLLIAGSFINNATAQEVDEMMEMSLEDLMNIEITSVSKKAERLQDVASSIYVLSAEDIKSANATTLHEALRLVPGYWGVQDEYSSVQSNIRYTQVENALTGTVLYLLDGTPIQDQMFSSFSFRNFDIPLDEIDRIEVIRGSGGTVYGANSATGVVNIFTKNPEKYDGINARAEYASGGYIATSLRAGGSVSDKLALSGYAKMRLFDGFGSLAGKDTDGNTVVTPTRFTENYDAIDMFSFGFKANYNASENTKISLKSHYNTLSSFDYANYFGKDFAFTGNDVLTAKDMTASRLVANVRVDQTFSDNHSLFARVSTNAENDYIRAGGGYEISNNMIDFEIQDNLSLGNNNLSLGFNYRRVNFDVFNINETTSIDYLNKQSDENLIGFFAQDKLTFADGKVNLIAGLKGEKYSLINDTFYFSPMAKISFIPNQNLTIWGGFTQSYSTPGFTNTNLDFAIFQTPDLADWAAAATQGIYQQYYQIAIAGGNTPAEADAFATNFLNSTQGQTLVANTASNLQTQNPNIYVKNGSNTVPTKFQTFEVGVRTTVKNTFTFESNFYYTYVTDGIGVTPEAAAQTNSESPTEPGRFATYYLYGNYVEGTLYGTESAVKFIPSSKLNFELTHSFIKSSWKSQENPDFDVNDPTIIPDRDRTLTPAIVPQNIFRLKGNFQLPANIKVGFSMIYATEFATQGGYLINSERYANLVIDEPNTTNVSPNSDRLIGNIRIEKMWLNDQLSTYVFGNDIFNDGIEANANPVFNVTRSQIARMVGVGLNYKFK